jgi:hypothetical protein
MRFVKNNYFYYWLILQKTDAQFERMRISADSNIGLVTAAVDDIPIGICEM